MVRKTVRLDEQTEMMLKKLDEKFNIKSNQNAVFNLAIQRLYWEEISGGFGKRP